jgi:predicted ATPase
METAFTQLDNYLHGVYFVSLAPLDSPEIIIPTIAKAVGFSFYTTAGTRPHEQPQQAMLARQQLLNYLEHKSMLIIMDNFEHLLDGVELVIDILQTAPDVDILATSRVRLNVQGEHLYPVAGMNFPELELVDKAKMLPNDLERCSAVKLFLQQAHQVKPDFALTAKNMPHILQICCMVEGMPLGILLATGWLTVLSPEEIAAEIGQSFDFLETDLSGTLERQRSMRIVFDHSWRLLNEREQEVFRKLSVFRGGFTRQAAKQVTSTSLHELKTLVDKSLLQRHPGGRYLLHELLRQYALEKLGSVPDEERNVRDLHCTYYAGYLQQRYERLIGKDWIDSLAEIESEIENVRAGWRWATNQSRLDDIGNSLETMAVFYRMRSWYQEGEEVFAKLAKRLEEEDTLTSHKSKLVLGRVLSMQGWMCTCLQLVEKADDLLLKSLVILRDLDARRERAYTLYFLGRNNLTRMESKPYLEKAIAIFKEIDELRGIVLSMRLLGMVAIEEGNYMEAKLSFEEGLSLCREIDFQEEISNYLNNLGYLAWILGNYEEAKKLHKECLTIYRDISASQGMADTIAYLAITNAGLKEYEEAIRLLRDCLAIYKKIGAKWSIAITLTDLGEVANFMGEYDDALHYAQEILQLSKKVDEEEQSPLLSWHYRVMGEAILGMNEYQRAMKYLYQALGSAVVSLRKNDILLSFVGIAALLALGGEKEKSLELLTIVLHHSAGYQWTKDKASRILPEIESELPPEITERAKKRGQARDLEKTAEELLSVFLESGK